MYFLLLIHSLSLLQASDLLDEKAIQCKVTYEQIQKLDKLIPEREAKGVDVSDWYTRRNQYLSQNPNCPQLKNVKIISPKSANKSNPESKANITTCSTIDLRKKLGPPKNQGKTGWCFAYTASDLLTAKLGKEVSAVGVAITFKTDSIYKFLEKINGDTAFRGGTVNTAIRASQKNICLESELPSSLEEMDIEKTYNDIVNNHISAQDCVNLKSVLPNNEIPNFIKIVNKFSDRDFLKQLAQTSCKSKIQHNLKAEEIDKSNFIGGINNVLNQGQPVGIEFDPRLWQEGTQYKGKIFDHAASVVGRKWNPETNSCRYMIRDSTGSNCKIYDKVYDCENGGSYTWIPESTLLNNTGSAYYLK